MKKYLSEFLGTFGLSFIVLLSVASNNAIVSVPVVAGLTLALFVYTIGSISGCHINPAVTLGLLSVRKISMKETIYYIIAQLLGAFVAVLFAGAFGFTNGVVVGAWDGRVFFAEMFGAIFFAFGIASVVYDKVKDDTSGLVVGGSLLFGILISVLLGAAGILNPAVAMALSSLNFAYLLGPIVGAILGFQLYKTIAGE